MWSPIQICSYFRGETWRCRDRLNLYVILYTLYKSDINIDKGTHCKTYEAIFKVMDNESNSGNFFEKPSESLKSTVGVWSVITVWLSVLICINRLVRWLWLPATTSWTSVLPHDVIGLWVVSTYYSHSSHRFLPHVTEVYQWLGKKWNV